MLTQQEQLNYIEQHLLNDILKCFDSNAALLSQRIECSNGLDGFMSALYTIELDLKIQDKLQKELVIVKMMKGIGEFRECSKSYTQFANEIFVYDQILPAYKNLLRSLELNSGIVDNLVPHSYYAQYGMLKGQSVKPESVLALRHLKADGYKLGSRLTLRQDQLEAMCNTLGTYHALGYCLRILQPQLNERLRAGLLTLPFAFEAGTPNVFAVLYRVAFDRFYNFYDRQQEQLLQPQDADFKETLQRLRDKYFTQPLQLLEHIRCTSCDPAQSDSYFSTFVHGDFNRNNVLFHEDASTGSVDNIKMIDFQLIRYTTTAIDISFFMYMNTPVAERGTIFPKLLQLYHRQMFSMLKQLLQRNKVDLLKEQLNNYSFPHFNAHFKRYALYGVLICMNFRPWLMANKTDCNRLSQLFEQDMHGSEYRQLALNIAGDEANHQIFEMMRHAFKQGYLDWI